MLDWDDLDPGRVERVAQMLVRDAFGATSIDGAGGDEAQDLRWESPDGLVIFEVKSFRKRLAGSQKAQVKRSLLRAVDLHAPAKWVLVSRSNPRAPELAWLQSLGELVPGVVLEWLGRDWLDLQIAGREDLISYVEGEDYKLLRRARQLEHERAAVVTGQTWHSRLDELLDRGDEISPYWRWDVVSVGGRRTRLLAAKRPESAQADPITIEPVFSFPADDPEAEQMSAKLRETLGVGGDVTVPGRFVESFAVTATSTATQRLLGESQQSRGDVRISSIPDTGGLPLQCSLVRPGATDSASVSVPVTFTERLTGSEGFTLLGADASGALDLRLVLQGPVDAAKGTLTLTLGSALGRLPHEVLPALTLLAWSQLGDHLQLRRGPVSLMQFPVTCSGPSNLRSIARLVSALDVVQTHTGRLIEVPGEAMDAHAVRGLLAAAAALTGQQVRQHYDRLHFTVRRGMIGDFLNLLPGDAGGALYSEGDVSLNIGGRDVVMRGLATWAPRTQLENLETLREAALTEPDAEHVAHFKTIDGEGVYLIRAVEGVPGAPWRPLAETA